MMLSAVACEPLRGLRLRSKPNRPISRAMRGANATVIYGAGARREAAEIRKLAAAAAPDLHGTYGGGPAAAHPLILAVEDSTQADQVMGRDVGQVLPAGSVSGPFAYVFLRQYRRIDPVSRGAMMTGLMTHLATQRSLGRAPTSLRAGVDAYEQNRYLNSRGYGLPLDRIAAAYPAYPTLDRWTTRQPLWGLNGPAQQLAGQDALAALDSTADVAHRITTELRPVVLDILGLEAAIEWYAGALAERTAIPFRVQSDLAGAVLDPDRGGDHR